MKKKIIESEYTTIRIHKQTAKKLESLKKKNYDEAIREILKYCDTLFETKRKSK